MLPRITLPRFLALFSALIAVVLGIQLLSTSAVQGATSPGNVIVLSNGFTSSVGSGHPHLFDYDLATGSRTVITCSPETSDPSTCVSPWFPDIWWQRLGGVAVDTNQHFIFTFRGFPDSPGSAQVIRLDPANPNLTTTSAGDVIATGGNLLDPIGIALDANGNILVADTEAIDGAGAILRIDPATGAQTVLSSGGNFVDPTGVAVAASGEILVADPNALGGPGAVIRVDPASGAQTVISAGDHFSEPYGIGINAAGNILVADWDAWPGGPEGGDCSGFPNAPADRLCGPGAIIRVDPASGVQIVVSTGGDFENPRGVATDFNGNLQVVDVSVGLIQVDPASGAQTMIDFMPSYQFQAVAIVPEGSAPPPTATPTPTPAADTVDIQRAEYESSKDRLRVEATSTDATATLDVFVTATDEFIGTLNNDGGGKYKGEFIWPVNPENITVKSSSGGSDSADVTLK